MGLKSISYIIAVLLIIVISVSAITILYYWQKLHQFQTQVKTGGVLALYAKEVSSDLEIISTFPEYCPRANNNLTIYFRNSGTSIIGNFSVYFNGRLIEDANFSRNVLEPNEVASVTITVDQNYTECSIMIISKDGARDKIVLL